ncbi:MAG: hypothetical protein L6461_01335 [Anaerolineae bacterium]|nr:hypothetical protein [Anaerolineae bacterium]
MDARGPRKNTETGLSTGFDTASPVNQLPDNQRGHRRPHLPGSGGRLFEILPRLSEKAEWTRQPTGAEGDKCQMI